MNLLNSSRTRTLQCDGCGLSWKDALVFQILERQALGVVHQPFYVYVEGIIFNFRYSAMVTYEVVSIPGNLRLQVVSDGKETDSLQEHA